MCGNVSVRMRNSSCTEHVQAAAKVPSVLLLTLASIRPRLEGLKKIEQEYSLCHDFDTTWAVRPLALSRYNGQNALELEDPGGDCKAEVSLVYPFRSS